MIIPPKLIFPKRQSLNQYKNSYPMFAPTPSPMRYNGYFINYNNSYRKNYEYQHRELNDYYEFYPERELTQEEIFEKIKADIEAELLGYGK